MYTLRRSTIIVLVLPKVDVFSIIFPRGSTRLQHFHFRGSIVEPAHELWQEIIFMWLCSQTEVTSVQSGSRDTNPRHVYMYTLSSTLYLHAV